MIKKKAAFLFFCFAFLVPVRGQTPAPAQETILVEGLTQPVQIIKDKWGIAHIYAGNQNDLFFAQGFNVASDRLFQLEVWRRQATGMLAEILGPRALKRDIGARLLRFRSDIKKELAHYHPQGEEIITAFVKGINAYIDLTRKTPDLLPLEFRLLGIRPGHWTPDLVVSRHNGLFRNVTEEIAMAQSVSMLGPEKVKDLIDVHPGNPKIEVDIRVDPALISSKILELYSAARSSVQFAVEDIAYPAGRAVSAPLFPQFQVEAAETAGSNNWVVSGRLSSSGFPLLTNDPHRALQIPSLRYWVHLNAPGWNVIGGGEPALPGVSIGHNERGAWGITIFAIDQEDLYVYETNPANVNQYDYRGRWEDMRIIREQIPVKGEAPADAVLKFTRHGPVVFENVARHKAYALRAAWLETGCAPYLASLRIDQARTWREFRKACAYSRTPSLNMIWADRDGNTGWQVAGLAPLRKNWTGLVPVPGNGRYEWADFIPAKNLPYLQNPEKKFIATANQDNIPEGYPYALGFIWAAPFRFMRISEILGSGQSFSLADMAALQQDVLSIPARVIVPLYRGLKSENPAVQSALQILKGWDYVMAPESAAAAIYMVCQRAISENLGNLLVPKEARDVLPARSLKKTIDWLQAPDGRFGADPAAARDKLLIDSLAQAVGSLTDVLGPGLAQWRYGQEKLHHVRIRHPLSDVVKEDIRRLLDVGPLPRGGNGDTVNMTTSGNNQTSGATFRILSDLADWDRCLGANTPGQSGDPKNRHYADLFEYWAKGEYFPAYFSRAKIASAAERVIILEPTEKPRRAPPFF
jgi:penicillin amidase